MVPAPVAVHRTSPSTNVADAVPLTGMAVRHRADHSPDAPLAVTSVTRHEKSVHALDAADAASDDQLPLNASMAGSPDVPVGMAFLSELRHPPVDCATTNVAITRTRIMMAIYRPQGGHPSEHPI